MENTQVPYTMTPGGEDIIIAKTPIKSKYVAEPHMTPISFPPGSEAIRRTVPVGGAKKDKSTGRYRHTQKKNRK